MIRETDKRALSDDTHFGQSASTCRGDRPPPPDSFSRERERTPLTLVSMLLSRTARNRLRATNCPRPTHATKKMEYQYDPPPRMPSYMTWFLENARSKAEQRDPPRPRDFDALLAPRMGSTTSGQALAAALFFGVPLSPVFETEAVLHLQQHKEKKRVWLTHLARR